MGPRGFGVVGVVKGPRVSTVKDLAMGSHGGALPGIVGASLVRELEIALGRLPWCVVYRNPVMGAVTKSGQPCLTGIGGKGAADLHVEVLGPDGRWALAWLECKEGSGELNRDQVAWHQKLQRRGRHAHVVRSVDEGLRVVGELREGRVPRYDGQ